MDPNTLTAIALILLLLLLLLLLLWLLKQMENQKSRGQGSGGYGSSGRDSDYSSRDWAALARAEAATKAGYIQAILSSSDEEVKQEMLRQAGLAHLPLQDTSDSAELVKKIAAELKLPEIESLHVALTTQDIKTTSKSTEKTEIVNYPTNQVEPGKLQDLGRFDQVTPEGLAQDPALVAYQMATQNLPVMDSYENTRQSALHYLVGDVSSSMSEHMRNGRSKDVYARGVIYRFLIQAQQGHAKCFLRLFDGSLHPIQDATTPEQATKVMEHIRNEGFSGGGTDITKALKKAVSDIKTLGEEISDAEIVLISDGEDDDLPEPEELHDLLGDIKLHVIAIGNNNPSLKAVAATYTEVR